MNESGSTDVAVASESSSHEHDRRAPLDDIMRLACSATSSPVAIFAGVNHRILAVRAMDSDEAWNDRTLPPIDAGLGQRLRVAFEAGKGVYALSGNLPPGTFLSLGSSMGVRVCTPDGRAIGTLHVADYGIREWLQSDQEHLCLIGRLCGSSQAGGRRKQPPAFDGSGSVVSRAANLAGLGAWELDLETGKVTWSEQTCRIHDLESGHQPSLTEAISFYTPEAQRVLEAAIESAIRDGQSWNVELPLVTAAGRHIWVRAQGAILARVGRPAVLHGAFQDITEWRRDVDALLESERRFRNLFSYSLGLIFTHDLEGNLLSINPAACHALGWTEAELRGRSLQDIVPFDDLEAVSEYLGRMGTVGTASGTVRVIPRHGDVRIWLYQNVLDRHGADSFVLGHAQDITEQERQAKQLHDASIRDALTGAFNRRYLVEFADSGDSRASWACVLIDLVGFKQINDTHGHQRGDEVLVVMVSFFRDHAEGGVVIRLGGDEFLVLYPHMSECAATDFEERISEHAPEAPCGFTSASAQHYLDESLEATINRADRALYSRRAALRGSER